MISRKIWVTKNVLELQHYEMATLTHNVSFCCNSLFVKQCGYLRILLPLGFYVKSILRTWRNSITTAQFAESLKFILANLSFIRYEKCWDPETAEMKMSISRKNYEVEISWLLHCECKAFKFYCFDLAMHFFSDNVNWNDFWFQECVETFLKSHLKIIVRLLISPKK